MSLVVCARNAALSMSVVTLVSTWGEKTQSPITNPRNWPWLKMGATVEDLRAETTHTASDRGEGGGTCLYQEIGAFIHPMVPRFLEPPHDEFPRQRHASTTLVPTEHRVALQQLSSTTSHSCQREKYRPQRTTAAPAKGLQWPFGSWRCLFGCTHVSTFLVSTRCPPPALLVPCPGAPNPPSNTHKTDTTRERPNPT